MAGSASANSARARRTSSASERAQLGRGRAAREVGLRDAVRGAVVGGQVDPVERGVLADVADEVGELEGLPEAAVAGVMARRHPEQRRHDPPDRAGRAVHVGLELLPAADPDGRAVDAHRAHVRAQLAEREPVAGAGVDQRADDGVR